ncbi:hypothetical protein ACH4F6_39060 [Streptomyces sp. NPDC017936]|uniref:hypothetical protein n=1 Tax=Streptomyces sp. NPDC017936 TaxID=3365016 RepID=UPI0037926C25
MAADDERPRLPRLEPQEYRVRAEEALGGSDSNTPWAIAWALLAVAGELHEIRRQLRKR